MDDDRDEPPPRRRSDLVVEMRRLAALRDRGELTEEEFQRAKAKAANDWVPRKAPS